MALVRELRPGDEEALERFLVQYPDTSMFLRNNWRGGGLAPGVERLQGTWAGAFEGDDVVAAAAHFWNGNVLVEAKEHLEEVVLAAVRGSGRPVLLTTGTPEQVTAMRACLGLEDAATQMDSVEDLFRLTLADLCVPEALAAGDLVCRYTKEGDVSTLVDWRVAYMKEALNMADADEARPEIEEGVRRNLGSGDQYVLERDGVIVSSTGWNARVEDCYQVGGVWTPPPLRSQGLARCVVAGSLLDVRSKGVARSILFTPQDNHAAKACYAGLGYEIVGTYCLVFFAEPQQISV